MDTSGGGQTTLLPLVRIERITPQTAKCNRSPARPARATAAHPRTESHARMMFFEFTACIAYCLLSREPWRVHDILLPRHV